MAQSLILVDRIIVERSYLVDDIEFIRLACVSVHLLAAFSTWLAAGLNVFLNVNELLNRFFYGPAMPHSLNNRIHKAIKLIRLIAQ